MQQLWDLPGLGIVVETQHAASLAMRPVLSHALRARTFASQKFPGINTAAVAVVPVKVDCIFAYRRDFERAGRLLIDRQGAWFGLWRLADFASGGIAFFVAGGAWACIA